MDINLVGFVLGGNSSATISSNEEVSFRYPNSSYFFTLNQAIEPIFPIVSGSADLNFSSNPPLPSGLNLNPITGEISGIPDVISSSSDYTITAVGNNNTANFLINLTVSDCDPTNNSIHIGSGVSTNPFRICNVQQLQDMTTHHIANTGAYYRLEISLDLGSVANFTPIGNNTNPFIGTFDGQDLTISNLTINNPGVNYQGLFGYVEGGLASEIKNIRIINADVTGANDTGVVVGYGYVVLNRVVVENGTLVGGTYAGGLTGRSGFGGNPGRIYDSSFIGSITCGGNCGGIAGYGRDSEIHRCYSNSTINSTGSRVAGIVGWNVDIPVSNSHWEGSVVGSGSVGGIFGRAVTTASITNSYANGSVSVVADSGGMVGASSTTVVESFYNSDVANHSDSGNDRGEPRTEAQMLCPLSPGETCSGATTYVGWDTAIWNFGTASDFPCLISVTPGCN